MWAGPPQGFAAVWAGRTAVACGRRAVRMAELRVSGSRWWLVLSLSVLCLVPWVSSIEIYAPDEVFVENGTDVRLQCSFKSTEVTSTQTVVIWKRKGQFSTDDDVTMLYYSQGSPYPENNVFKGRVSWAGDLNKRDVSLKIKNIQFKDNGTYECHVFNPPDVIGPARQIKLRVVEKENLPVSNVSYLVGIICGVIGGVLLIAILIFALVIYKKKKSRKNYSGCSTTESLMSVVKQPPAHTSPSGTETLVKPTSSGPSQGPVIYAQLDHSGKPGNQIIKSESVVYSDIRRLC